MYEIAGVPGECGNGGKTNWEVLRAKRATAPPPTEAELAAAHEFWKGAEVHYPRIEGWCESMIKDVEESLIKKMGQHIYEG